MLQKKSRSQHLHWLRFQLRGGENAKGYVGESGSQTI